MFSSEEWLEAALKGHKGVMASWGGLGEYYSEPHWDWGLSGITGNYQARFVGEFICPFHFLSEYHKSTAMGECLNQRNRYKHHMHKRCAFIDGTLDLLVYSSYPKDGPTYYFPAPLDDPHPLPTPFRQPKVRSFTPLLRSFTPCPYFKEP